jgi:hypothetical protein
MRHKVAIDHAKELSGILRNADSMMITSTAARTTYANRTGRSWRSRHSMPLAA